VQRLSVEGAIHRDGLLRLTDGAIQDGVLRTLPGIVLCDGFFAALLIRD
jgi:16S rRNA (cytosine967-C5)-methyltransferase